MQGATERVAAVHLIFHRHHVDRRSDYLIAKELNDLFIVSPGGREWSPQQVRKVRLNAAYLGRGIRYRTKSGVYVAGGEDEATPSGVTLQELANTKRVRSKPRPREEWKERPAPQLDEFLPESVRAMAADEVEADLSKPMKEPSTKTAFPERDRHRHSTYVLKGILRSRQGGHRMTGHGRRKGDRKYAVSRAAVIPKTKDVLARRVPAEPLEAAVLEALRSVLLERPRIEEALRQVVEAQRPRPQDGAVDPEQLRKEVRRKRRQYVLLSDDLGTDEVGDDDPVMVKLGRLKQEIEALDERLRRATSVTAVRPACDTAAVVGRLAEKLEGFARDGKVDAADVPLVRAILEVFVGRLEVDLITNEVEVEFALPSWMGEVVTAPKEVGLDEMSAYKTFIQAPHKGSVKLADFDCTMRSRPTCFDCRRRAA